MFSEDYSAAEAPPYRPSGDEAEGRRCAGQQQVFLPLHNAAPLAAVGAGGDQGRRGPRRAAYISDSEVVEARRGRLRKRRRDARSEAGGRWDGRSGVPPVRWWGGPLVRGMAPIVGGSAGQKASGGDGEAGNRKRPSPSRITRIAAAMYGNAAICVICLTKSTRQKKVRGANICAQPRGHTMVARYMKGRKEKKV
jgi:hypothetical protein